MSHKVNFSCLGYSNLINIEQFVYNLFPALQQESNGIHNELERIECLYQNYITMLWIVSIMSVKCIIYIYLGVSFHSFVTATLERGKKSRIVSWLFILLYLYV